MNENLNLVEILKDCKTGTKLYSPIYGDVELVNVRLDDRTYYPIEIRFDNDWFKELTKDGKLHQNIEGECILFPSKDQRDWSKFRPSKPKFDPNTLNPFDKVLARNDMEDWSCVFFSHIVRDEETYPYACGYDLFTQCIPYNEKTKYLVGTNKEAHEFYRYWED